MCRTLGTVEAIERIAEPPDGPEADIFVGRWAFHRDALRAKCADLSPEQMVARSAAPSPLTLLGIVRHMAGMERMDGSWPLGPVEPLAFVWGDDVDDGPEWDFDVHATMVDESVAAWQRGQAATDARVGAAGWSDSRAPANGRTLRWNLHTLVGEYAHHNGDAELLRERIDGRTGE